MVLTKSLLLLFPFKTGNKLSTYFIREKSNRKTFSSARAQQQQCRDHDTFLWAHYYRHFRRCNERFLLLVSFLVR